MAKFELTKSIEARKLNPRTKVPLNEYQMGNLIDAISQVQDTGDWWHEFCSIVARAISASSSACRSTSLVTLPLHIDCALCPYWSISGVAWFGTGAGCSINDV